MDVNKADPDRVTDEADPIAYGELLEDVVEMRLYGHFTDEEFLGDLGVVEAERDETRDLALTRG